MVQRLTLETLLTLDHKQLTQLIQQMLQLLRLQQQTQLIQFRLVVNNTLLLLVKE